jgi:ABC-type uncharacterized transport system fused permease/ATPase subunit
LTASGLSITAGDDDDDDDDEQEKLEGSFRYSHASFRSSIEAISLYGGTAAEGRRIAGAFDRVVTNRRRIVNRHFPLVSPTESTTWRDVA